MFEVYHYPRNYLTFWHIGARLGVAPVLHFLRRMRRQGKSSLLDIGSGGGSNSLMAARMGLSVTSCDQSTTSLDEMNRVARALILHNAPQRAVGDGCALAFADASFDIVFASHIIEHLDDPRRLLDEIARVLKPGGTLRLACPTPYHGMRLSRRLGYNLDPPDHKVLGYSESDIAALLPPTLQIARTTYQGRFFESNFADLQQLLSRTFGLQANPPEHGDAGLDARSPDPPNR